jgi:hypothetical protein
MPKCPLLHTAENGQHFCLHPLCTSPLSPIPATLCAGCTIRNQPVDEPRAVPVFLPLPIGERVARLIDRWLGVRPCQACTRRKAWLNALHYSALVRLDRLLYRLGIKSSIPPRVHPNATTPCSKPAGGCGQQAKVVKADQKQQVRMSVKNPLPDVTFCVTSFERPAHLARLLASIDQFYPGARVIVADCSRVAPIVPVGVELISLPFDAGLSEMRNALVKRLTTKFLLLLEEDFLFTAETKIAPLMDVLQFDGSLLCVAGSMRIVGRDGVQDYTIDLEEFRGALLGHRAARPAITTAAGTAYRYCDKALNFALYRRDGVLEHTWDGLPKVGEHAAYFLRVKRVGQWRVAHTPMSVIDHDVNGRTTAYVSNRSRAWGLQLDWLRANGLPGGYRQDPGLDDVKI